jgi:hypothetical protein
MIMEIGIIPTSFVQGATGARFPAGDPSATMRARLTGIKLATS